MSKRPLSYEILDEDGALLYESRDKMDTLRECRNMIASYPQSPITYAITQNGKKLKVLASFSGDELIELIEDELDD